jgi:hypothetical protein
MHIVVVNGSNAGQAVIFCLFSLAGYPLHSPVSPTLPLPCVSVCHQVSILLYCNVSGPGSSVGIAIRAGRSGDRIPVGARFFAHVQTGPGAHPASCTMGTGSVPGVERGRGVTLTPHPLLVPRSKNRVEIYLYSVLGSSWPVKRVKPKTAAWKSWNRLLAVSYLSVHLYVCPH